MAWHGFQWPLVLDSVVSWLLAPTSQQQKGCEFERAEVLPQMLDAVAVYQLCGRRTENPFPSTQLSKMLEICGGFDGCPIRCCAPTPLRPASASSTSVEEKRKRYLQKKIILAEFSFPPSHETLHLG